MNILEAQKIGIHKGNDSAQFDAAFPGGLIRCVWIDAEQGLFESVGLTAGYTTVATVLAQYPNMKCYPIAVPNNVVKFKRRAA
jgi:hypothetical protein